jgi:hypothetical protein
MALYTFVIASFYFGVVLPKFKSMGRGTWASTSIAICLCILSPTSFTFVGDHAIENYSFSSLSLPLDPHDICI